MPPGRVQSQARPAWAHSDVAFPCHERMHMQHMQYGGKLRTSLFAIKRDGRFRAFLYISLCNTLAACKVFRRPLLPPAERQLLLAHCQWSLVKSSSSDASTWSCPSAAIRPRFGQPNLPSQPGNITQQYVFCDVSSYSARMVLVEPRDLPAEIAITEPMGGLD